MIHTSLVYSVLKANYPDILLPSTSPSPLPSTAFPCLLLLMLPPSSSPLPPPLSLPSQTQVSNHYGQVLSVATPPAIP